MKKNGADSVLSCLRIKGFASILEAKFQMKFDVNEPEKVANDVHCTLNKLLPIED